MSAEHKRPMYAFVAVTLVGVLVLAMAARSDALRSLVHREVAAIVAGSLLDPEPGAPREAAPESTEPESTGPAEEILPAAASTTAKQRAHRQRERAAGRGHHDAAGHASGRHGRSASAPGHTDGRGGHGGHNGQGKVLRHQKSSGPSGGQGNGRATGHDKSHDKSHGKSHGKSQGRGHGKSHGHSKGHHRR